MSRMFRSAARPCSIVILVVPLLAGCGGGSPPSESASPNGRTMDVQDERGAGGFLRVGEVVNLPEGPATAIAPPPDPEIKNNDPPPSGTATAAASSSPASGNPRDKSSLHAAVVDSSGGLSESEVRATIIQQQAAFRQCYEIGLQTVASGFSGTVTLRATIGPTGTVGSVEVLSSSTKSSRVDECVSDTVKRMQFPAKGGGAVVGFPIEFGR